MKRLLSWSVCGGLLVSSAPSRKLRYNLKIQTRIAQFFAVFKPRLFLVTQTRYNNNQNSIITIKSNYRLVFNVQHF